jgi:20S proteasome subunit beta 1
VDSLLVLQTDTQFIADLVKSKLAAYELLHERRPSTRTAAYMAKNICYYNKDALSAAIICAGGDGSIYSIPLGGAIIEQPLALSGSGSTYIVGFCEAEYREDMRQSECVAFVQKALELAMSSDAGSGGIVVICVVTPDGAQKKAIAPPDSGKHAKHTGTTVKSSNSALAWQQR